MTGLIILPADLDDAETAALLVHHAETARAQTARGSAHALGIEGLRDPAIAVFVARLDGALVGCGALKHLRDGSGEVKAMHTRATLRRRGIASAILAHLAQHARAAGLSRLYLETGSWPYFAPAVALYRRHGFTDCPPFADYRPDPNSLFLTLDLSRA